MLCYHIGPISVVFIDSALLFISCIFSVPVVCFLHDIVIMEFHIVCRTYTGSVTQMSAMYYQYVYNNFILFY